MASHAIAADYIKTEGQVMNDFPYPLRSKFGNQFCFIMNDAPNILRLEKSRTVANTRRTIWTTEHIQLPEGFRGKFSCFTEVDDTLFVFVMANDMQTCAVYNFATHECVGHGTIPTPIPTNSVPVCVVIKSETNIQLSYHLEGEYTTIDIHL